MPSSSARISDFERNARSNAISGNPHPFSGAAIGIDYTRLYGLPAGNLPGGAHDRSVIGHMDYSIPPPIADEMSPLDMENSTQNASPTISVQSEEEPEQEEGIEIAVSKMGRPTVNYEYLWKKEQNRKRQAAKRARDQEKRMCS